MPKFRRVVLYLRVDAAEVQRIGDLPSRPCAYLYSGRESSDQVSQISVVRAGGHGKNFVFIACTPNAQCYECLRTQTLHTVPSVLTVYGGERS